MTKIGLILLAAGASTRMGTPKQLLPYQGQSLIQHGVNVAIASGCEPVLVVLGANGDRIQPELAALPVPIVENPDWQAGMSTSIQAGIRVLQMDYPDVTGVVLMVCDQPFVSTALLHQLMDHYQTGNWQIVATEYGGILGVPALFHPSLFPDLMGLQGDTGARKIIQQYRQHTGAIAYPPAIVDVDTPADYQQLFQ